MAASRPILVIPGPIEFSEDVLQATARFGTSHVDPHFIDTFGKCLEMLRDVFMAPDGQPFVVCGSGTLGWDLMACNLFEAGDNVLLITTGYFGDHFGECFETYGVKVDYLAPETAGGRASLQQLTSSLRAKNYKGVVITHVDTSTAVLADLQGYARVVREVSPNALVIADGVCALGGEEVRMKDWDIDAYLTGSQKCLGVPPGLSISMLRGRAMNAWQHRRTPIPNYYANFANWYPIMRKYEERQASYFATPAVNLIYGLHQGLAEVLQNGGMEARFREHLACSGAFKRALKALGLQQVPLKPEFEAHTLSAIRFPAGVTAEQFLPKLKAAGIIVSGGLHKDIKSQYFRVGHMGLTSRTPAHWVIIVKAIETAMEQCGVQFQKGAGLAALNAPAARL